MLADADAAQVYNYVEAFIWQGFAMVFVIFSFKQSGPRRRRCWLAAVAFCLFGLSDLVEVHTGAWWRPWWLFVWKAGCLASIAGLLWSDWREKRRAAREHS